MFQGVSFTNKTGRITGVGSALVDILIQESDGFVTSSGAPKGGMTLVAPETIEELLAKTTAIQTVVPGGSACNAIIGVGRLGGTARFIGKRGTDAIGVYLEDALKESKVEPHLATSTTPTGRVLSVITPDAQRTMYTSLAAAAENSPADCTADKFAGSDIVHIEGYLVFNKELFLTALKVAKAAGALISLDLANFTVVEASRDFLFEAVREYVDILIANEDEAKAYTGLADEEASVTQMSQDVTIAVLKQGKRGSLVRNGGKTYQCGIIGDGYAIDTTGAGDLWAAGFLYGLVAGFSPEKCQTLAAACGYEVCQVVGAHIPDAGWQRIAQYK